MTTKPAICGGEAEIRYRPSCARPPKEKEKSRKNALSLRLLKRGGAFAIDDDFVRDSSRAKFLLVFISNELREIRLYIDVRRKLCILAGNSCELNFVSKLNFMLPRTEVAMY